MTCSNLSLRVNLAVSVLPKTGPWPTLQPSEQLWQQIAHSYTKAEPSLLSSSVFLAAPGAAPAPCVGVHQLAKTENLPGFTST